MTVVDFCDFWELCTRRSAVDTSTLVSGICAVARMRHVVCGAHSREALLVGAWEINLKRTAEQLLVTQELEKVCVILGAATDEIHGWRVGGTKLDVLATIIEA